MLQKSEWLANGSHELTPAGNMRPPKKEMNWVLRAWEKLPEEMIKNSFKSCALNLPTDGSRNVEIHCFKNRQPCENGAELLKSQLSILDDSDLPNPFENMTD